MTVRRLAALALLLAFIPLRVQADGVLLRLHLPDRIRVSERTNLSRRDDGRYIGLLNRQVTGYLTAAAGGDGGSAAVPHGDGGSAATPAGGGANGGATVYEGRFLVFEQTRRDMQQVGRGVDQSISARLTVDPGRAFTDPLQFPTYLAIPDLPDHPVRAGDTWEAPAAVILEVPGSGGSVTLPVQVAYRYGGTELFEGSLVHRIEAQFATRYPQPPDDDDEQSVETPPLVPPPVRDDIVRIIGRHLLTVLIPAEPPGDGGSPPRDGGSLPRSPAPLFIRDELEEQYEIVGKPVTLFRGHTLLFVHGLSAASQRALSVAVRESLQSAPDVRVEQTGTGTRLTVNNIRFVADQAVILPDERGRLEQLARALAALEDVRFLVVGHTADVGSAQSQLLLSRERAEVIVRELVARGLDPAAFDVEGRGGTEPAAPNATEEGRARNRRVEIYILEQ